MMEDSSLGPVDPNYHPCTLGFNPCWEQTLQFRLRAPELVLVRFVVEDYDTTSPNDFVGQSTLPLSSLKQGMMGGGEWEGKNGMGSQPLTCGCLTPQGTATSTCCPRMEPRSLQPRSSCTSAFRTLEGVTDLTLTSAGLASWHGALSGAQDHGSPSPSHQVPVWVTRCCAHLGARSCLVAQ